MKFHSVSALLILLTTSITFSQGGWVKITDPQNAVSNYTTIFPYAGASFIDINNDNLTDIHAAPRVIFINQGNGNFTRAADLNFTPTVGVTGSSWADLDNDGDNDCVVSCTPSRVFFNNGTGIFSNGTHLFPGLTAYGSFACAIGDYNEDRMPDVFLTHAEMFHPGSQEEPCRFYFLPDTVLGTYTQVTGYPFLQNLSSYTNPYWSDYDQDGDMDLFIASGPVDGIGAPDPCYKNMKIELGVDTLFPMTDELFAQQNQDGQCYNFIDYDNDGDFDLCITNYFSIATRLYRNDSGVYVQLGTPFTTATTNIANCWGDYDNDGDLDVVITNDNAPTRYFRNDGGTFIYLPGGLSTPTATNGAVNGDYDNDGDLDIFFNGVGNNGNNSSVGLFRNDTAAGNRKWVNIKLTGTVSNRSALGAIIRIKSAINGMPVWQMREVNAQNSFQGQNDLRVHFGLSESSMIDSVIIKWPKGLTEIYTNVNVNTFYTATEGQEMQEIVIGINQVSSEIPISYRLFQNFPNPFNPATKIKFLIPQSGSTSETVKLEIFDATGRQIHILTEKTLAPGTYEYEWNAINFPSGVYFYRLNAGKYTETKKMILIK